MMTELYQRTGQHSNRSERHDPELENGITVNQNGYGSFTDRVYDVRGFDGVFVQIKNVDDDHPIDYQFDIASKNYDNVDDLIEADFETETATTELDTGETINKEYIRITPRITALRVRLRRGTSNQNADITGIVSAR